MGFLWTQKRVKTLGFLRFLKRLFEAPDGSLGSSLPILLKFMQKCWSKMCFKNGLMLIQNLSKLILQKIKTKKNMVYFSFFFGAFLGTILGPILGSDRPKRGQDEPKRAIWSFKEPKSCIFKNPKKLLVF